MIPSMAKLSYDPYRDDPEMNYRFDGDFTIRFLQKVASMQTLLRLKREKHLRIVLVIPTKNEGSIESDSTSNIGTTLDNVMPLKQHGLIDVIQVIDSESTDDTRKIAQEKGVDVLIASEQSHVLGGAYIQGKGTNLRIAIANYQAENDLLIFCDADFAVLSSQIQGVLSPLICEDNVMISLAWMIRETQRGNPNARLKKGGRATEGGFRPIMRVFYPELEDLQQPICGLYAIRGSAASSCIVPPDYRVETALITQIADTYPTSAFAQTFCGTKRQTGQSSERIADMIQQIVHQATSSAHKVGRPPRELTEFISYPTHRDSNGVTVIQREVSSYIAKGYPPAKDS